MNGETIAPFCGCGIKPDYIAYGEVKTVRKEDTLPKIKDKQKVIEAIRELDAFIESGKINDENFEIGKEPDGSIYYRIETNNYIIAEEIVIGPYGIPVSIKFGIGDKRTEELIYIECVPYPDGVMSKYAAILYDRITYIVECV